MKTVLQVVYNAWGKNKNSLLAWFSNEESLFIKDIWEHGTGLGLFLKNKGVETGSRVIVKGDNTRSFILSVFGCWFCGAVVLPIEESIDDSKLINLVKQFNADFIIHSASQEMYNARVKEIYVLEVRPEVMDMETGIELLNNTDTELGALCIYTSGSTGDPKGVLLSHGSLYHGAINVIDAFLIDKHDIGFCVLPMTHINGLVTTLLAPLVSGGKVMYYQGAFEVEKAIDQITNRNCTWMSAIPMHYTMMVNSKHNKKLNLKFCRSAAAPLPVRVFDQFEKQYELPLIETMGMTEAAGQIFANPLPPGIRKPGSVGKTVNYEAIIVDDNGIILPNGDVGELLIKGNSMMREYLDDQRATKDAYLDGWLKTGDLAKKDEDGYVFIEGRKKHMAIFAGVNIPLGSIEKALLNLEGVSDAVCISRNNDLFGEVVESYVVLKKSEKNISSSLVENIKSIIKPFLPSVQAMGEIFIVNGLPKTSVGKIDRLKMEMVEIEQFGRYAQFMTAEAVIRFVLDKNDLVIDEDSKIGNLPGWDSLAQVKMIHLVELSIGRELSIEEMNESKSARGIQRLLESVEGLKTKEKDNCITETNRCKAIIKGMQDLGFGTTDIVHLILSYDYLKKEGVQDVALFVRMLIKMCPDNMNIMMNGFNWNFCKGLSFSKQRTPCQTGLINECFRVSGKVLRGNHPIYSYLGYGPKAQELVEHNSETCWGEGSTTMKLLKHPSTLVICGGVPFPFRNPIMHALEEMFEVDYRYFKQFMGWVDMGNGLEWYQTKMFVRDLDLNCKSDWLELGRVLKSEKLVSGDEDGLFAYKSKDILKAGIEILNNNKAAFLSYN